MKSSYLHNERFSGGTTANDSFWDVIALSTSLVVHHGAAYGQRPGKLNYPVAIEVVLSTQVLESLTCKKSQIFVIYGMKYRRIT